MSGTSAFVIVKTDDEEFKCAYVGYDGYPSGLGTMLISHYNNLVSANGLVSGGHMVAVKDTCDRYDESLPIGKRGTEYYIRDCGADERACSATVCKTIREAIKATDIDYVSYVYVWMHNRWFFGDMELDWLAELAISLYNKELVK